MNNFQEKPKTKAAMARAITEKAKELKAQGHNNIRVVFLSKIDRPFVVSVFVSWLDENGIARSLTTPKGDKLHRQILAEFDHEDAKWFEIAAQA
jgi:hypothetical protein